MEKEAINSYDRMRGDKQNIQNPENSTEQIKPLSLGCILNLYSDLSKESKDKLSLINGKEITLIKNQKINFYQHHENDIYIINNGWVSLFHSIENSGRQDICNIYMLGDIIGMRESFFTNQKTGIIAMENCKLKKFSFEELHQLFKNYSDIKKAILTYIMVNDNITIERLRSCTHYKAEKRIAHFFLEILERRNFKKNFKSNSYPFPITQDIVGELLGLTSVHVSRCMTALEQKKMIRKSRNKINLLQPEVLAELTGFDRKNIYGHINME